MDIRNEKVKQREESERTERKERSAAPMAGGIPNKTFWKQLFWGMTYALGGYVLGLSALPFGARPLGLALLCGSDRNVFYIYAGLCLSAWNGTDRFLWIGVYTAVLLVRFLVRLILDTPLESECTAEKKTFWHMYPFWFSEHIGLRMSSAALAAFAVGITHLIQGGFLYYDLYGTILSVLIAPTVVLLCGGLFTRKPVGIYRFLTGFLTLAVAVIWATRDLAWYGVSVAVLGCMLVTLYLCRKQGIVIGMIAGIVCGLAVSPQLAPLFAFAALSFGLLASVSVPFAATSAFSVGIAWGMYVQGIGVLNGLLGGLLTATVLFCVLDKLFFSVSDGMVHTAEEELQDPSSYAVVCVTLSQEELDGVRLKDTDRHLQELSAGFASLAEVFRGLSRKMQTPTVTDLRQICDNAFDVACVSCSHKARCWGERYHKTAEEVGNLSMILHRNGHLETEDVGADLKAECERLPDILDAIRHHTAEHKKEILQGDRTEIFAMDYQVISEILGSSSPERKEEYAVHVEESRRLCTGLAEEGFELSGACVWGYRRKHVVISGTDQAVLKANKDAIGAAAARLCSLALEEEEQEAGDAPILRWKEKESLSVVCAQRNLCAEGEEKYCGDTAGLFRRADGRFYAFISDGMGSGREAALTSGVSGLFLRKMLGTGISCKTTLEMLNGFLRNRGTGSFHECSATVDLMELDLMHGKTSFYKSGAAPTYVFRNGSLFKLRSHTVPVGIIRELDIRKIEFDVSPGDVVVMVSDGVTQGKEECSWLFDLLRSQGESASPERLADLIVKYAKGEGGTDDISVLVIQIKEV